MGRAPSEMDDPSTWAAAPRQALGVQVERGAAKRQIQSPAVGWDLI